MKKVIVAIVRGIMWVASRLPLRLHYFMGDIISWIIKKVVRYRSSVVWMNISRSFPDEKLSSLKKIYNDFYRHFGEIIAETIWFGGSSFKRLTKTGIVHVKNPETLVELYEKSPSVTVLCSHCGNWEILGGFTSYVESSGHKCPFTEKELSVVYKRQSSDISDAILAKNRLYPIPVKYPHCIIESKSILRFCIEHKNEKRVYAYPADQSPYKGMGRHDIGEFLHQKTYAMTGSVGVACKLSHSVVYLKTKHIERGKYEWKFITICEDASQFTPDEIIRRYYDLLEKEINETPYNWLWTHNRWKI